MSDEEQEPYVSRLARLQGGLVAVHNAGTRVAYVSTGLHAPVLAEVEVPAYPALVRMLELHGFRVLGIEFYERAEQLNGTQPPDWRSFCPGMGWLVHDATSDWTERSTCAYQKGDRRFGRLAAQIAFGLRTADERLRQAALAYSAQLRGRQMQQDLQQFTVFQDLNSLPVTLAIHAMFYDLGSVRDTLAQFLARYVFQIEGPPPRQATWDMAKLVERLRSRGHPADSEWHKLLLQATDKHSNPPGWLAQLAQYRNLFMHSAPLHFARRVKGAVQEMQTFGALGDLPLLYHPLPIHSRDEVEASADTLRVRPHRSSEPDALEYLSSTVLHVASLALAASAKAPYERMVLNLTEADIIGPVRTKAR